MNTPEIDLAMHLEAEYRAAVLDQARDNKLDEMQEWLEHNTPNMKSRFADCDDVLAALETGDFEQVYQAINEVPDHPWCDRYWRSMNIFRNELADLR
jgi:hypothetical protein